MPDYVAFLRAINVGGTGKVPMEDLGELLTRLEFERVRTLLQSGNVVFRTGARAPETIERTIERGILDRFGSTTDVFVRSTAEWKEVIARNPFLTEAGKDPGRLVVTVLKAAPRPEAWRTLTAAIRGREMARDGGRHAYIVYPDGQGTSKLTINVIERALGTRGTSRNWNTVLRVAAALGR